MVLHKQTCPKKEIRQQAISEWEPELKSPHREIDDETLQKARDLVNRLQVRRTNPKSKLQILTQKGWIGHIWPWDLDTLATLFIANRTAKTLPIDYDTWQDAMTQYLSRADCGCQTPTCTSNCKLVSQGLPPDHFQALAHTHRRRHNQICKRPTKVPSTNTCEQC
jgi:hypothetical protein